MPGNDSDLETNYSAQDMTDVSANDEVRVGQTATGQYAIHEFKNDVGSANSCNLIWEGQSDLAPNASPVVLEIFNRNSAQWDNVDTENISDANTDFTLSGNIPDLTNYKDGSNIISCRVYQLGT